MTRLIDADALLKAIIEYPYGYRGMIESEIADQQTVDAIPIEWLIKHISTIEQQRLLEEWEKENGQID